MKYNQNVHHRRSIRLIGYDYSLTGCYFITLCCQDRIRRFGHVENGKMILNEYGQIAHDEWMKLSVRFPEFDQDVFQIMPDHFHGIISITPQPVGAGFTPAQNAGQPQGIAPTGQPQGIAPTTTTSVSAIIGAYKSLVANACLKIHISRNEVMGKFWQRNYYEHIIRNEGAYHRISEYIINNPEKWGKGKLNQ